MRAEQLGLVKVMVRAACCGDPVKKSTGQTLVLDANSSTGGSDLEQYIERQ